jgi:hypothetical protein
MSLTSVSNKYTPKREVLETQYATHLVRSYEIFGQCAFIAFEVVAVAELVHKTTIRLQ